MKNFSEKSNRALNCYIVFIILVTCCLISSLLIAGCTSKSTEIHSVEKNSSVVTMTDSMGNTITLPGVAKRVICLNSDAAELLVAISAGDTVVGTTSTTLKTPVLASQLSNAQDVGAWDAPSVERIISLHPDAIITYAGYKLKNADQFEKAGIRFIYLDCNRLSTIANDAKSLGTLVGKENEAAKYIRFVGKWTKEVEEKTGLSAPVPVYIEGYTDYSAQGANRSISDMIELSNAENIAKDQNNGYIKVTPEWVIKKNPAVIIKEVSDPLAEGKSLESVRNSIINRTGFSEILAVKEGKVYTVSGDLVLGPRAPAGLVYIAAAIHPEIKKELNVSDALNEYARDFVLGTNNEEVISPSL